MSEGAGTRLTRISWPGCRSLRLEYRLHGLDDGFGLGRLAAGFGDEPGKRIAAADFHGLEVAALEPLGKVLFIVVALLAHGLVDHGQVRSERGGCGEVAGAGLVGGRLQHGVALALRGDRIGEVLGSLGHQLIDLVDLQLDPVLLRHHAAGQVGEHDGNRLRRVLGRGLRIADRRCIGIELEGIEGWKLFGVFRLFGGKPGDDAHIRLDGDVFAGALMLDHRVVDHVAAGKSGGGELDAVLFLHRRHLPVAGEGGAPHRLQRRYARPLDGAHHALAVGHVHGGVDGDADETDADDAGKTGGSKPLDAAALPILPGFAEIDRREFALRLRCLGKIDGGKAASPRRDEGLTRLTAR